MVGTAPLSVQGAVTELSKNSNSLDSSSPLKLSLTPSPLSYKPSMQPTALGLPDRLSQYAQLLRNYGNLE